MTPWLLTLALGFLGQSPVAEPHEFPLEPGMYWNYEGNVVWAEPGASAVQRRQIAWRTEIVEVITRDWTTVAVLKGHPRDLVFFDPKREPRTPGMQPGWDDPDYTMSFRSPSSNEFIGFAPGIGITSYDFNHRGTSSEVQLKLTAFGRTASR